LELLSSFDALGARHITTVSSPQNNLLKNQPAQ
jgi:hypothetical protein